MAIGYLERFAADFERQSGHMALPEMEPAKGIKVAVVGSGPSGLSFAGDMAKKGYEVSNGLRAAVLLTGPYRAARKDGAGRKIVQTMVDSLKIPKATYFTAVLLMESTRRLAAAPTKGKQRFIHNRDFLDALDYNRIVLRAEGQSEKTLDQWATLYEEKGNEE